MAPFEHELLRLLGEICRIFFSLLGDVGGDLGNSLIVGSVRRCGSGSIMSWSRRTLKNLNESKLHVCIVVVHFRSLRNF